MSKQIAFTFDDGPNTLVTPRIKSLFEKYDGKCTFFLIGRNINEESAKIAKECSAAGFEIENHSFTHTAITELSDEELKKEIDDTDRLIEGICNVKPVFFRPPYIAYDEQSFEKIRKTFICGLGCDDWDEAVSVETRVEKVLSFADDGVIVLLHDSDYNHKTADALEKILPVLKERGFKFVTLLELFKNKGIELSANNGIIYSRL